MSRDFPDWVNPDKAAAARREFSGTMPLDRLERLADMIADPGDAEIGFHLDFGHDDQRQVRVEVAIDGVVPLKCQRTLKVFGHRLKSRSVVGIVSDERAAEALPDDYEPLLCANNRVELVALIEEEMLLGLPLVPVDPDSTPVGNVGDDSDSDHKGGDTHRPFAELAELKKNRDTN